MFKIELEEFMKELKIKIDERTELIINEFLEKRNQ